MKALDFDEFRQEDGLLLSFEGAFDQTAPLQEELEPFFNALEQYAGDWMPDIVQGKRQRKYSRAAIWKSWEEVRNERTASIEFFRTQWPALSLWPGLRFPPLPPKLHLLLKVKPLSFFAEAERCRSFVELVRAWASRYPVSHASAHSLADDELAGAPDFGRDERTVQRDGFDKVYELSWLNVLGPKLVESMGRERVLSTPAHRVEEMPNGSILLVTWPTAADFASDAAREAQARAHVHLRPELDLDTVRRTLRERSALLAPVEPRFHPDVAPLLSRVVERFPFHERPRKTSEFNAWQPPEPTEWVPAQDALAPDVEDPERLISQYGLLAEHFVVMLHSQVPSVMTETPESLTDADFQLWKEDFTETRMRHVLDEVVVPAVGAYLGQVLVRHLGGQWLPRKKLGQAQVLVGSRVWWPMVRAQRYLRSRQALLDFSLSQLYRVAERHRA